MPTVNSRQLVSNFSILSAGEFLTRVCTFATFTFLARVLGPESFGYLEFTLAVMVFFTLLVDFGTSPYGAREIAKNKDCVSKVVAEIMPLRLLLGLAAYLILSVFAFSLIKSGSPSRPLLLIYGLSLFGIPGFLQWVFQGLDKMKLVAAGSLLRQLLFAAAIFLFVRGTHDLTKVALIECFAVAGFVIYCLAAFKFSVKQLPTNLDLRSLKSTFSHTLPIGLSELTWACTWYFATILLGLLVAGEVIGWFSAAHRPVMTLHTFIWMYFYNLFPSMSRLANDSSKSLKNFLEGSLKITAWIAIFLGITGTMLARPLIMLVFGPQYAASIPIFSILVWLLPIAILSGHYRYALIAGNKQSYEFFAQASAGTVTAISGLIFIPTYYSYGAAFALLSGGLVNWAFAYFFVRQKICDVPFWIYLTKPLLAGSLTLLVFQLLRPFNFWVAVLVALLLFFIALTVFQQEFRRAVFSNYIILPYVKGDKRRD